MWTGRARHGPLFLAAVAAASSAVIPVEQHGPISPPGGRYVAMGSSFAAGPGVAGPVDAPPSRCARSTNNYARQLARRRGLHLVDVSCSGATTAHVLGPWAELPPQIDAVTPDTRLVTVTIGGNDVGYIGDLIADSCARVGLPPGAPVARCPKPTQTGVEAWRDLESQLHRIAREVRRRARDARLIFVDYLTLLPEHGGCADAAASAEQAVRSRRVAQRLAAVTARVARQERAEVLRASRLSREHDLCDPEPWVSGYPRPGGNRIAAPYHPTLPGMTAIAEALDRMLASRFVAHR